MNREMLKEAIAEAKTIKETAIASAKAALEEAFTPQLTAMFAEKLNEMEEEELEETKEMADENYSMEEEGLNEFNLEEILAELGEGDENMEEGIYEAEDDMDDMDMDGDMPSNEDLEMMIKNILDQEIAALIDAGKLEAGDDYEKDEEGGADEEELDVDAEIDTDDTEAVDEEISIEELLAEIESLTIDEGKKKAKKEDEKKDEKKEKKEDKEKELKEAYNAIAELKAELNEVNLLNAKLLYTNKIFKSKNLTESEKVKVLNTFDKAETVKEVKLVFETLTESFKATAKKNPIKESLGSASRTVVAAPKQEQIIEVNDAFTRMQRLAGLR